MNSGQRDASLVLAEKYRRSGLLDKAVEAYREYLSRVPQDAESRLRFAEVLLKLGKKDGAISQFCKAQELLAASGDVLGAISAGVKVIQIDPRFENPLSYVVKVQTESLQEKTRRQVETNPLLPPMKPLLEIELLSELSPMELGAVAENMQAHAKAAGDIVFQEGDAGESLYFVSRGVVEAVSGTQKLGRLAAGDCFGEFSFLTGQPRTATVTALEPSELLELSAADMKTAVESHPRLRDVLNKMYRERALLNVLARSPLFQMMSIGDRGKVAERVEIVDFERGEPIFRQGEKGSAVYIIKSGKVEVRATGPTEDDVQLAVLGSHPFIGEVSFLTGVPRTATVVPLEDCELLRIGETELRRLVDEHPELMKVLKTYHLDRVWSTANTLKSFLRERRVGGILH
jgi:CRP-like cAMP-binding protein